MTNSLVGQQLANYRIEYLIGRGGMAEVYFAHDVNLKRPAAIKLIDARYRDNPDYARRFLQEARTIAAWRHSNIVQVYYADEQDGIYFFAMEYIDGLDLADILRKYGDDGELMPLDDVLNIGYKVADALDYAHKKGVIHRDIKPSNIMIGRDNRIVLMDFGLALDVQEGTLGETFGSAHYISPEQAMKSSNAVPASDLYSLGIIIYEMLTGVVPFDDESFTSIVLQHMSEPPPPPRQYNPELSAEVENILLKALAKEPADRFASGTEFIKALDGALKTKPALADTDKYVLPPIPSSVSGRHQPTLSQVSVADRIQIEQSMRETSVPFPSVYPVESPIPTAAQQTAPTDSKLPRLPIIGGIVVVLLILLVGGFMLFGGGGDDDSDQSNASQPTENALAQNPTTEVDLPSETPQEVPTSADVIEDTATPQPLPTETEVVAQIEYTSVPTEAVVADTATTAPTIEPTIVVPTDAPTLTPIIIPTEPVIIEEPTVAYPDGYAFTFYYDGASFYASNTGGRSFNINGLSFEALDQTSNPTGKAFLSNRWIAIANYASIDNNRCDTLEMGRETWLRPDACRGYNAIINPVEAERFWLQDGVGFEFRILWSGEEVGRCPLYVDTTQECVVKLPQ